MSNIDETETQKQLAAEQNELQSRRGPGTSMFTHQDDATAPIHTTSESHQEAHIYGGDVAPKHQLRETTILGPPAFGSPDPRTLGHVMNPLLESHSAPELDPTFVAAQKRSVSGVDFISEEDLQDKSDAELRALAGQLGVPVEPDASREEVMNAIFEEEQQAQAEAEGAQQANADNYEEQSRDDLMRQAMDRNVGVSADANKDEIIDALRNSDQAQAGGEQPQQ